ncbi:zinc finger, PMZ-type containing protein [Tanacetum coccineum]
MKCICNMWQLSGIPCVHAMAGYMHIKMNPDLGVDEWYSQCKWYEAYQFSIKPVYGPKFWKPTSLPPPLPLVERKMIGRPRKRRIRYPTEDDEHVVTRVDRAMHFHKCWETRHNKTRCHNQERPKLGSRILG